MPFPAVIEIEKDGREKAYDVYTRLAKDRILFLNGVVEENMANHIIATLLWLESQNPKAPINMYVNSPGGSVVAGMAIYDIMMYIQSPITTIVTGQAASMGSLLACAGNKRLVTVNSRHMIHQPLGGAQGQATEVEIAFRELQRWKKVLTDIYVKHTGHSYEKLEQDMDRDNFMTAEEAVKYNLADEVVNERKPD